MPKTLQIPVFKAEREAGLTQQVQTSGSIAYVTKVQDVQLSQEAAQKYLRSVGAETDNDQFDLFYLNTILVTTGWNKNSDVFGKPETWVARYTPVHKQFNLGHDQSKIIGHMTSARAVDDNYEIIPDETVIEELPSKFHILTGAVIYRALANTEAQEQIENIIKEIGEGKWFVSMECLFSGFDYAITAQDGAQRVIARNEETAFLTKHLRQYGGTGKYDNFSVGRYLKNITFSGKGLVRDPANPESVIVNDQITTFAGTVIDLGYITSSQSSTNIGDRTMANDTTQNNTEIDALKAEILELKNKVKEYESSATNAKITSLTEDVNAKAEKITTLEAKVTEANTTVVDLTKKLKDAETKAETAEVELAKVKAEEVVRARVALLTEKGASKEEAEDIVTSFKGLDDTSFAKVAALSSAKWVKPDKPVVEPTVPDADSTIAGAKPEPEPTLAAGTDEVDENENLRTAMATLFASKNFLNTNRVKQVVESE